MSDIILTPKQNGCI